MTKGPDGTTRVVTGTPTSGIVTKPVTNTQQSLIKLQTTGSNVQQVVTPIKQQIIQQQGKFCFFIIICDTPRDTHLKTEQQKRHLHDFALRSIYTSTGEH